MSDEADALSDMGLDEEAYYMEMRQKGYDIYDRYDLGFNDIRRSVNVRSTINMSCQRNNKQVQKLKNKHDIASKANVGTEICCSACKTKFVKTSYQKVFCSNKGKGNCKDKYWNLIRI